MPELVETGPAELVIALICATLPVPIYVMLLLWIDRYESEPLWMLATAFFWGALSDRIGGIAIQTANVVDRERARRVAPPPRKAGTEFQAESLAPARGRFLDPREDARGAPPVAVLATLADPPVTDLEPYRADAIVRDGPLATAPVRIATTLPPRSATR